MKIILKIITILIVASLVAGGFWLAFNSNSASLNTGQPSTLTNFNGQSNFQPTDRRDGGEGGGSIAGIFLTLVKITGITAIVLLIEKVYGMVNSRKLSPTAR